MHNLHRPAIAVMAGVIFCCADIRAEAGLFRWTDSTGHVHYADSVPPSASQGGHTELNKSGLALKNVPAAKSPEQAAEQDWLDDLATKQRKLKERQQYEDSQLLSMYADVGQLDKAHVERINLIQASRKQLELLQGKLKEELTKLQQQLELVQGKDRERVQGFIKTKHASLADYDMAISQNVSEEKAAQLEFEAQRGRFVDLLKKKQQEQAEDEKKRAAKEVAS